MEEIWKSIKGYEEKYKVSNKGNVKNILTGNMLSQHISKDGYCRVGLYYKNKNKNIEVHRLIAETFIENKNKQKEVNHIDGNKLNNNVNNLEWTDHKENMQHAWKNGLCENSIKASIRFGKDNPNSKKIIQLDLNNNIIKEWDCIMDAVRATGINQTSIGKCCNNRVKTAGGYIWKFKINK